MDEIKGNIEDNRSTEDLPTPPDGVRVEGSQPVGGVIPPAAPEPLAPAGAPAGAVPARSLPIGRPAGLSQCC